MGKPRLTLLGGFTMIAPDGAAFEPQGQKARALLAILVLSPRYELPNEKIISLLWSDRGEMQGRDSLKHAVIDLRRNVLHAAEGWLKSGQGRIQVAPDAFWCDVTEFRTLTSSGDPSDAMQAMDLFRGDLLDGLQVRDPGFEEWLREERAGLRSLAEHCAGRLLAAAEKSGDQRAVIQAAERLSSLDPLSETACRAAMRAHVRLGERSTALRLFSAMKEQLRLELDAEPDAETGDLERAIRRGQTAADTGNQSDTAGDHIEPEGIGYVHHKPSIAVLPFQNMSGDTEQDYFADGMVEEIITALSRMHWLLVIARNSSFTYKGKAVDVRQVGRDLGVRYVMEGSVRKAGDRVRVTGQLIDTSTGAHIWADHFDGDLEDVFDLQDQVTASVIGAIAPRLERAEIERAKRKPTESLDAYDYFLRGMACVHQWTREANNEALDYFALAIRLDPEFATAYGMAARCYSQRKVSGWEVERAQETAEAERLARLAAAFGKDDAIALCTAGMALAYVVGDLEGGAALIERSRQLNPNLAWAGLFSGWVNVWLGKPEIAIERLNRAMLLSPHDPHVYNMQAAKASAHFVAGRYAEASSWAERAVREQPNHLIAGCIVAASAALDDRLKDAQAAVVRLRQLDPKLCGSDLGYLIPLRRSEDLARLEDGLRKAGLPD